MRGFSMRALGSLGTMFLCSCLLAACTIPTIPTRPDHTAQPNPTTRAVGEPAATAQAQLLDIVAQFLTEDDWPYAKLEDKTILRTNFLGKNGQFVCYAQTREDQYRFMFYCILPFTTPENQRTAMAEFVTRANYGMLIGNFEMDFADGEVRYKTSIDVEGDELTPALIKQMIYTNVLTTDKYLPSAIAVSEGSMTPAEAIAEIED